MITESEHPEIPSGCYCYEQRDGKRYLCPHWNKDYGGEKQNNGYCGLLKRGDWEVEGLSLLWDQVKECSWNHDD